jgi:spore maturation protein A
MNYLWAGMILVGIVFAAFHGTLPLLTEAALDSAKEAVTLCITMTGVMSFWMGLMKIAEKTGIIAGLSRKLMPLLRFLFPHIPQGHMANEYIAANFIANIFGLGWAATPAGLKAMEALSELEEERRSVNGIEKPGKTKRRSRSESRKGMPPDTASSEMCTFLILNISSLQLISVNIIAYRSQYGSVNPSDIVGPGIIATAVSTAVAVLFCKWMERM